MTTYVCRVRSLGPSLRRNSITWGINHANPIRALWKMVESILHAIVFRAGCTGGARGALYTPSHFFKYRKKTKKQMFIQLHAAMTILRSKLHSCTKTFAGHAVTNPKINDFIVFQGIGNQVKILFHFRIAILWSVISCKLFSLIGATCSNLRSCKTSEK